MLMKKPSAEHRKLLGSFLASRRARLQPEEIGLPARHRRSPGLRREEVAVLAGVSVSWYTWLEQGRDIQDSADIDPQLTCGQHDRQHDGIVGTDDPRAMATPLRVLDEQDAAG